MQPRNSQEEYRRVWSLADYGALDALAALRGGASTAGTTPPGGRTLFPEGMPTGISTVVQQGQIKPTPAVKSAAQDIMRDPQAFVDQRVDPKVKAQEESLLDKGKSLLGQIFDVSDTWKDGKYQGAENPVESVWDSFLGGVGWFYDRISQLTVAGISGLPGGVRTLSWDEANDVSVGQVTLANAAISLEQVKQGNPMGIIGGVSGGVLGTVGALVSPDLTAKLSSKDFDIADAQDRKIFEEDPIAKWASGITDAVFTVAADPLIVGGKALKFTRLKFVDRPLTPKNVEKMVAELDDAVELAKTGDVDRMAPIARIAYDAVTPKADGTRPSVRKIIQRDEIAYSHNAEGIADALGTLRDGDFASAVLVMKAGLGDVVALRALSDASVRAADTLINAQRSLLEARIAQDPTQYAVAKSSMERTVEARRKIWEQRSRQRDNGEAVALKEVLDAEFEYYDAVDSLLAIENGRIRAAIDRPTQAEMSWFDAQVKEAEANYKWFKKVADQANFGAFAGADRGFATNTPIGRFVSKRRAKRAEAAYERKSVSGQKLFSQDYFGNNPFTRVIRFWHVLNDATPSYYVNIAANTDQGREVEAFLDSLKYLSGAPLRVTDANGIQREIGGVARKDELFQVYTSARARGEKVKDSMAAIQSAIRDDLTKFYGIDPQVMEAIHRRGISEYDRLRTEITTRKDGYFLSDEASNPGVKGLNVAPFLETQLANGEYFLPWDTVERIAINVKNGKITDPSAKVLFTPGQELNRRLLAANDVFQDFWRPLVLFRLGYPQRNVAEGLFRSIAFSGSLQPLLWAGKAGLQSAQNFRRVQRAAKKAARARTQVEVPDAARDRFDGLVARQKELHVQEGVLAGARARMEQQALERQEALIPPSVDIAPRIDLFGDGKSFVNADKTMMIRAEDLATGYAAGLSDDALLEDIGMMREIIAAIPDPARAKRMPLMDPDKAMERLVRDWEELLADLSTGNIDFGYETVNRFKRVQAAFDAFDSGKKYPEGWKGLKERYLDFYEYMQEPPQRRYVFLQQDPASPDVYIKAPGAFQSLDEAQNAVFRAATDAFEGTRIPAGPQFRLIADRGAKARALQVDEFVDTDGVIYSTVDEISEAQARISQELGGMNVEIQAYGGRPIPEAMKNTAFQKWRTAQVEALRAQVDDDLAYEQFVRDWIDDAGLDQAEYLSADANLVLLRQMREQRQTRLSYLESDDYYALEAYANQAQARRVANNGTKTAPINGVVLQGAFGDPRYRDLHWLNMSSDNTIRATLASRMALNESLIYRMKIQDYVDVHPGMGNQYWDGMAAMLRQYSQSALGRQILRRGSDADVAAWLIGSREGQVIRDNLDAAWVNSGNGNGLPRIGNDLILAEGFVAQVRAGLEQITAGNRDVWAIMLDHPPTAMELRELMKDMPNLSPVVGSKTELEGYEKLMSFWRKLTQKAFQKIGTQVEDAFVRGPFYAQRFEQTRDEMLAVIRAQYRDQEKIPVELLLTVERNAHRRALKDTKDFLYTIDRRTKLGKYGEIVFPFISATQNSLTSVGRLIRRDPSLPGIMLQLWQAPSRVGWEDDEGNIIIPLPSSLLPDGVEDFFGLRGMKNMTISKSSLNVIFPESGFAFVPRPTPLVQAGASELMKNGLFGQFGVEAPPVFVNILGPTEADKVWKYFKDYLYGEEGGISAEPGSYDKLLPPVVNRMVQYLQKDGSQQYAYQYAIQARTQDLLWRAQERDEYPTAQEIMDRTNGQFLLRMLGNMLAFTPPNYESSIQPLIDMQRVYDEVYGIEGPMKFSENFGNEMLILAKTETTTNPAGATATPVTVRNIKKYDSLIRRIVPSIGQDYDVLGMLLNENPQDSFYDPSAYRWMMSSTIPGTNQLWRDTNSGAESMAESQRQAGWVEYIKFKNQLDAILQQRGLESYRVAGAADLNAMRKEFIGQMRENPMYEGWRVDWDSQGSSKTQSAIQTMRAALSDEAFLNANGGNKTWIQAARYLEKRDLLVRLVKESGVTLENDANQQLKDEWEMFRQQLMNEDLGWANIANRYLGNDDNPIEPGASFQIGG